MTSQDYMEEIDCASFFDHIDDLIEFPLVKDTPLDSINCNEFTNIWTDNSDELQVSDSVFIGSRGDNKSIVVLSPELSVPYEDIVQMEWLSNFVEDSFSGGGMTINKDAVSVQKEAVFVHHQFQTSSPVSVLESSSSSSSSSSYSGGGKMIPFSPIQRGPQKARSKRPRPTTFNPRPMNELLSPLVFVPVSSTSAVSEPAEKKKKKPKKPKIQFSPADETDSPNETQNRNQNQSGQGVRKCMHCEITKTPQWRAGPMGPKSLCNACGVRYKSGRLFPEYRPAASPTFVPTLHSNSHKKVVEMRTKFGPNETMAIVRTDPEPELIPNIVADYIKGG
ncbi:GATA transcription factor 8-like [Rutidosis leptorrhynchoides]|uniref:GATA transcription factor 8-like n=1 Tax=Rutidosis leptorrhynchoides TaxID=125765 RepID=UPI003A992026